MSGISAVLVAVPARDEEAHLPAALRAIRVAAERCPVPVVVAVAVDACVDGTARIAEAGADVVVRTGCGRVGGARRAAVDAGLLALGLQPESVWIASTDADSQVPADWLAVHLAFAADGVRLLRGAVRPDDACPPDLVAIWNLLHPNREHHERVHGANLGVRADAYLAAGGFPDAAADEDVALVRAVEAAGLVTASTGRGAVLTSGRLTGRVEAGFAGYLRALDPVRPPA